MAKPDPFFARPDGKRAQSAWLSKLQATAREIAEKANTVFRDRDPQSSFLPGNTLEQNLEFKLKHIQYWDAPPVWECLLQWHGESVLPHLEPLLGHKDAIKLTASLQSDAAQAVLLRHLDMPDVRDAVAVSAKKWPLHTLRGLLATNPSRDQPAAQLLQRLLYEQPEWLPALRSALQAEGDEAQAKTLARLLTPSEKVTEAGVEELPALLREPPWRAGKAHAALPVLALTPRHEPAVVDWSLWRGGSVDPRPKTSSGWNPYSEVKSSFEHCLNQTFVSGVENANAALRQQAETEWGLPGMALFLWGVRPERITTVLATNLVTPDDLGKPPGYTSDKLLNHLSHLDDTLALSLLRQQAAFVSKYEYHGGIDSPSNPIPRMLKRFGAEHIDVVFAVMPPVATKTAQAVMDIVDWDGLALRLSQYGYSLRDQVRAYVLRWLLAHPSTSARALIPAAFSDHAEAAAHARFHLRLLAREGQGEILRTEARAYGDHALAALEQLLTVSPEAQLPSPLPKLPAWLVLPRLPRLLLAGNGHAIPLANLPDALMPLVLSKGGMIYPGLEKLQAAVTPDSLARLMLGLFEQWLENDLPAKDRWILELQGRLGDDANARALAPRIREWRGRLDRVRSYEGLELLAQIGSDTALMLLSTFREQKRYGDLQDRAAKALERVAEERGLTLEQLADRTVPTLGLDERGLLHLDFGPRQFTARLNADLVAQVHDAEGARLKDLPKPGAKDDATLAKAAVADWKEFKKQAKLVASSQSVRLEAAMCAQRRWPAADFLAFFAQHPVLRTLCQRLVWAAFDADGALTGSFRVSEDLSLADAEDAPFELDAGAGVGLPHPLELAPEQRDRWGALLADYTIFQPFEQLARLTYALSSEEMPLDVLPRYQDRRLGTGSLLGLEPRGWKRDVGDEGMIDSLAKPLGDGHLATLVFEPGWHVGGPPNVDEQQTIRGVHLSRRSAHRPADGGVPPPPAWRDLSAILRSEMLRDLERLAWHTRD